jgi:predicted naringenin-chalcone synthase
VLNQTGNLSSASILAVLERAWAAGERLDDGQLALLLAIGPGLSLELSLLDWSEVEPWPSPQPAR